MALLFLYVIHGIIIKVISEDLSIYEIKKMIKKMTKITKSNNLNVLIMKIKKNKIKKSLKIK